MLSGIIKYACFDLLRSRFILAYTLLLFASSVALYQLDSDTGKVVLSLLNVVLMVVPLISVVFTSIHFFNSYEFMELMLAQPVNRKSIFIGEYISITISLCMAYLVGIGVPSLLFGAGVSVVTLILVGLMLTCVFV